MNNLIKAVICVFLFSCSSNGPVKSEKYSGLGAGSLSEETVRKYAPPPADPNWIAKVQKLLDLRGATTGGVLSVDGKTLFYNWNVTGISQVWKIQGPLGFPIQMTAGQDATSVVTILPNGKDLVLSRDRAGEENPGLYLQSVEGGPLRVIYHQKGVQARASYVTDDSRILYFMANSERSDSYAIHRYEIATGRREVLFSEPGTWSIEDVRDEKDFLLSKATGSLWAEFYLWHIGDKAPTPLVGQGEKEYYEMAFSATKGSYLVLTPKFGDFRRLYEWKDGKYSPLTPDQKMDVSSWRIDHARKRIYLTWNDQGYSKIEVLDARTKKSLGLLKVDGFSQTQFSRVSRNGQQVLFMAEKATQPRSLFVKDWSRGTITTWLRPSTPEIDTTKFAEEKLEFYPTRDGAQIPMFVRRPSKCEPAPCPVIVVFHGGPESQATPGFGTTAQTFVDAGYVWVEPNVRGSDGYGKAWLAADDGPKRLNVVTDIEDAAIALKKQFTVNGKVPKIGVMGGSYGGYSTLYAMTRFAGAYDAGAATVGMSNLLTFLNNTAPYRRHLRTSEYGDPEKDREALIQLSPVTYLHQVKGPLLISQGLNDPRVPAGEAVQIQQQLAAKGLPSELTIYADEGHGSQKRDNRANQLANTLRFFEKYLKN